MSELKAALQADMKAAMRAGEKSRLGTIRLILAAIKQREVDERIELDDAQVLTVLDKMVKQRRESVAQFENAGREDLIAIELKEIEVIQTYLPAQLTESEVAAIVADAIAESGAASMRDMGKVMGLIKPKLQGRADMGKVSALIKSQLTG